MDNDTKNDLLNRYRRYRSVDKEKAWGEFCRRVDISFYRRMRRTQTLKWLSYAAVLFILCLGIGIWWLHRETSVELSEQTQMAMRSEVRHEAVLTLSDGTLVPLDESANGLEGKEPNSPYYQKATHANTSQPVGGQSLNASQNKSNSNSLSTGKSGHYNILLEDGTRVYLNESSRLIYPVKFSSFRRVVRLEGEAYFEVAKDADRPFVVKTGRMEVQQYGTSFNIKNREKEPLEVVLVEGSVEVRTADRNLMMKPGQMVTYDAQGDSLWACPVNTALYIAWHTGQVDFNETPLSELVKVLSQWYCIPVIFADERVGQTRFTGRISRQDNILDILESLEYTQDMFYTVEDNHILISR